MRRYAVVFFLAILLAGTLVANAQEIPQNITNVKPEAPEPLESTSMKAIAFVMFIVLIAGIITVLYGALKFTTGSPDAGKWLIRGLIGILVGGGFWTIVLWFL